jgi:hypothetical protein
VRRPSGDEVKQGEGGLGVKDDLMLVDLDPQNGHDRLLVSAVRFEG